MTLGDKPAFVQGLLELGAAFNADLHKQRVEAYWDVCDGFELRAVRAAFHDALKKFARMPAPAQVFQLLERQTVLPERTGAVEASLRYGEYHCTTCDDTGWAPTTRDASQLYGPGKTVSAVRRCACVATNPVIAYKRAEDAARRHKANVRGDD